MKLGKQIEQMLDETIDRAVKEYNDGLADRQAKAEVIWEEMQALMTQMDEKRELLSALGYDLYGRATYGAELHQPNVERAVMHEIFGKPNFDRFEDSPLEQAVKDRLKMKLEKEVK